MCVGSTIAQLCRECELETRIAYPLTYIVTISHRRNRGSLVFTRETSWRECERIVYVFACDTHVEPLSIFSKIYCGIYVHMYYNILQRNTHTRQRWSSHMREAHAFHTENLAHIARTSLREFSLKRTIQFPLNGRRRKLTRASLVVSVSVARVRLSSVSFEPWWIHKIAFWTRTAFVWVANERLFVHNECVGETVCLCV